jgi:hypothetical protein
MPQVHIKFFEDPVERSEEEIAELRALGLLREDAAAPEPPKTPAPPLPAKPETKEQA